MLTRNDLQQIRTIVKEEVQGETKPIRSDISMLQKDMKSVRQKLNKVSKDVDTLIPYFDKRITSLEKDMRSLKQN
jgi:hypothetical protein